MTGRHAVGLLLLVAAFAIRAGAQVPPADGVLRITQRDFKKLVASGNVVVIDTRNHDAYRQGHIPGAILLPLEGQMSSSDYEKVVDLLKAETKPIVAYCA